jgi:hypothetical protein
MPFKPKPITQELFLEIKVKRLHHWTFLDNQQGKNPKLLECRCDLCGTRHWVQWRALTEGRSKRCRGCMKLKVGIEVEDMNDWLKHNGSLWKLSGEFRDATNKKGEKIRRRDAWVTCTGCGKGKWNRWEVVTGLKSMSCAKCAQRKCSKTLQVATKTPQDTTLPTGYNVPLKSF